jgi:dipeptidyl aminopeptidase/acylaminoacyl peptidase
MRNILLGFLLGVVCILSINFTKNFFNNFHMTSPLSKNIFTPTPKPLEKYTFENLKQRTYVPSEISISTKMKEGQNFISYLFNFVSDGKKVSGFLNTPNRPGKFPIIVMFRGYVPAEIYESGVGTQHAGEVFAQNGFITLAPDFLGYGQSASPSAIPIEERFETYTTALNLLESVKNINPALSAIQSLKVAADTEKIGIWGHSNGGHIALALLELSQRQYPTVLWAPVSKPFPYSILYYTDDIDDHGKALRRVVSDFEKNYDSEHYSIPNYFTWIRSPIQLHQGTKDEAVPLGWSDILYSSLTNIGKDITYFTYPGDDHNFSKGSWDTVVRRNISFYREKLSL